MVSRSLLPDLPTAIFLLVITMLCFLKIKTKDGARRHFTKKSCRIGLVPVSVRLYHKNKIDF